jgi:hypothetical protein
MSALEITISRLIDPSAAQYIVFLMHATAIIIVYMLFLTVIRIFYALWILSRIALWVFHIPLRVIHFFSALVSRRHYPSQTFNHNYAAAPNTASTAPAAASKTASLDDAINAVFNEIEDLERRLNGA